MRPGPRVTARKDGTTMAYWFNIETQQVETDDNRSQGEDVMGPYETEAEAAAFKKSCAAVQELLDASKKLVG